MDEAEMLCDRVAIIDSGKIIAMESPDKLIDDLVATGFERPKEVKKANLEDVFINLPVSVKGINILNFKFLNLTIQQLWTYVIPSANTNRNHFPKTENKNG